MGFVLENGFELDLDLGLRFGFLDWVWADGPTQCRTWVPKGDLSTSNSVTKQMATWDPTAANAKIAVLFNSVNSLTKLSTISLSMEGK